jgi:hypothetical protein
MSTYTTIGSVRGSCGHAHRDLGTALVCLTRDQRSCSRAGGYSDRGIQASEGTEIVVATDADGRPAAYVVDGNGDWDESSPDAIV